MFGIIQNLCQLFRRRCRIKKMFTDDARRTSDKDRSQLLTSGELKTCHMLAMFLSYQNTLNNFGRGSPRDHLNHNNSYQIGRFGFIDKKKF